MTGKMYSKEGVDIIFRSLQVRSMKKSEASAIANSLASPTRTVAGEAQTHLNQARLTTNQLLTNKTLHDRRF
jgi:hypothetical protein